MFKKPKTAAAGRAIIALVLGLILAVASGEILLRVIYQDKFGKRPGFFVPDPVTGWAPAPNLNHTFYGGDFSIEVVTDSLATRLGRLGPVAPDSRLVLFCGDSNAFGWGVSTNESCSSYLDEIVAERTSGAVRVVNLGVGGFGTLQTQRRLENYLTDRPGAEIEAVIVVHSPNDPVDNLLTIGYVAGLWEAIEREKPRSRWHVVNFLAFTRRIFAQRGENQEKVADTDSVDPYLQDMLFAFERPAKPRYPEELVINGTRVVFEGMHPAEMSHRTPVERRAFSKVHAILVALGVRGINQAAGSRSAPVLHVVVPTAEAWASDELEAMISAGCAKSPTPVGIVARTPDPESFAGDVFNAHSGRHYTPRFNRVWARSLDESLRSMSN